MNNRILACAVTALLAFACNHQNDRPLTPANGSTSEPSDLSDPSRMGPDSAPPGAPTDDSGRPSEGTPGSGTPGNGTGNGTPGSGIPGSGTSGNGTSPGPSAPGSGTPAP